MTTVSPELRRRPNLRPALNLRRTHAKTFLPAIVMTGVLATGCGTSASPRAVGAGVDHVERLSITDGQRAVDGTASAARTVPFKGLLTAQ